MQSILIRPYAPTDEDAVNALEAGIIVYRPEDADAVAAMFERARRAQAKGDRWKPIPPPLPGDEIERFSAFWVAETKFKGQAQIVGTVAIYPVSADNQLPDDVPKAQEWLQRDDVAMLERLRVAALSRRQGIRTSLNATVIAWCRRHGYKTLVLNTTAAQLPALALYRKLGFQEAFRSFLDKYELVWFDLELGSPATERR